MASKNPSIVVIDEALCIGCTRCIKVCPVDAIIGAHRFMHTVIPTECIGCELCIAPCPMDCIHIKSIDKPLYEKERVKRRFQARKKRLAAIEAEQKNCFTEAKQLADKTSDPAASSKQDYIQAALAKKRAARQLTGSDKNHEPPKT
ncbi:MAG: RnfABCDGE type electron transport complex subunit [Gammaproteobacteria bacterium]|jgi:electron transport complex protein RnfB|nr:RnfABCDGE type electron transport complex subunit [Gammaproteobacteria bacterium]